MAQTPKQTLTEDLVRAAFLEQLSILYNAKTSLIENLPQLIKQATFKNLKWALQEELEDSKTQLAKVKETFTLMAESWETDKCLGLNSVITEAIQHVSFKDENHYESDMSILFYMSAIENMQMGACKILNKLAKKIAYQPYKQLMTECLDTSRDNSGLVQCVAEEYFDVI